MIYDRSPGRRFLLVNDQLSAEALPPVAVYSGRAIGIRAPRT